MTCICKQYTLYKSDKTSFESQDCSYTCGPIAIMNALRFEGKTPGPAVHRQVMVACDPKARHEDDGFKGTKPPNMDCAIRRFWPAATVAHGAKACLRALKAPASILLFQRSPRLQHYVFVHYDGLYHLENEAENETVSVKDMDAYMAKEPIVWALKT